MNIKILFIALALVFIILPGAVTANSATVTDRFISMALQGDLGPAQTLFEENATHLVSSPENDLAKRFQLRFIDQNEDLAPATGDVFADAVVSIYRSYWVRMLTREFTDQEGTDFLEQSLLELLQQDDEEAPSGSSSNVFDRTGVVLQNKGFQFLDTLAPPLRDMFLWRKEENIRYTVRLTDRSQPVRVTFMSEIYSMGWKEFATLGLIATTGWVEGTRLYCVDRSYDRNTENFRISFLKHESRHLADFERFPGLSSDELEYRAKLTELAFASTSLRSLLDDFTSQSASLSDSPHATANFRVTRDMYLALYNAPLPESGNPWSGVDTLTANRTARELLRKNSEGLEQPAP